MITALLNVAAAATVTTTTATAASISVTDAVVMGCTVIKTVSKILSAVKSKKAK